MSNYHIVSIPGDGIGKEVVPEAEKILGVVSSLCDDSVNFEIERLDCSAERFLKGGPVMTDDEYLACEKADAILMGAIGLPEARHSDGREVNGDVIFRLRFGLDLYAGVRPARSIPGIPVPLNEKSPSIDYVILRENTEGLYASKDGGCNLRGSVATDTMIITRSGTERVVDYAFKLAATRKRLIPVQQPKVTCVDKANVLGSYAFFRRVFEERASLNPKIDHECVYVDAMTSYQVLEPARFDVVVAENMLGDIISDLSSATVGGLGFGPSGDIGDEHALFQPAHGSAPNIAGQRVANPIATILSAAMMLEWLGQRNSDSRLERFSSLVYGAVDSVFGQTSIATPDIGGEASTQEVGDAVAEALQNANVN